MIKVEVWILQVHFQCVLFLEFLVSEYQLFFLAFDIVRQVELLVLIKNTEEVIVVGVVLGFILHEDCNLLLHFSEQWHYLPGKVLELLAFAVQRLLLHWVVHVFLDV